MVKSSIVVSPLSKNAVSVLVPAVGTIFTDRMPTPLIVTPAGTVNGNISVYVPG